MWLRMGHISNSFEPPGPEILGRFRIVRVIGEGSAGTVYLAERIDFPQRVAIKLLHFVRGSSLTETGHEQRLLSSLDHTNIVSLIDQGFSERGQLYLVLEHVDGLPIDQFCDASRLSIAARIDLLIKVMAGVSYAHRHLVVHADLKPSNILVGADGEPKLLDFGISSVLSDTQAVTASAFTPAFASPEQLRNGPITLSSDIYALGVVAALLLTGNHSRPEDAGTPCPATFLLKQTESARLKSLAEARSTTPARLRQSLAGDLDAILARAMQPDPNNRYLTAEAFCDDLRAHLAGRPIVARPAKPAERARKWVRRHLVLTSLGLALAVTVLFSSIGIILQTSHAEHERLRTQATLQELVRLTGALDGELYDSIHSLEQAENARNALIMNATKTLDRIGADDNPDPVLLLELAEQYTKVARLLLAQSPASQVHRRSALADLDKAIALLKHVSASDIHYLQAQQALQQLIVSRHSLTLN
jgi:serine/threonine protein kinase